MNSKFLPSLLFSFLFISSSYALDGDMYDFFLPNGLKVIMMEKHAAPKVAVMLGYNVGSHDEVEGQKGITNLIKEITNKGTSKYPKVKVDKIKEELQAKYDNAVGPDKTYFITEIPIENIEFALDLESDRMQNIIVSEETLSNSKIKIKTKYRSWRNDNPIDAAFTDALLGMFPEGHPYKTSPWGIMEQVDTLSIHTCQHYYNTYFSPNNAALIIVGNIIPEDLTKLIYQYFSSLTPTQNIPPDPDLSMNNIPDKVIQGNSDSVGEEIYFSFIGVNFFTPSSRHDDVIILEYFSDIVQRDAHLPGDISKKFTKNNRLGFGLKTWTLDGLGTSQVIMVTMNVFRDGSLNKIPKNYLKTLEFIGENGIDDKVLNQHKKYKLLESYEDGYNYSHIAKQLANAELINGDYRAYNRNIELLKNLSNEDIKRVVNKYLISDNMIVFHLTVNEKSWYTPIVSFIANQIILRFWNPGN